MKYLLISFTLLANNPGPWSTGPTFNIHDQVEYASLKECKEKGLARTLATALMLNKKYYFTCKPYQEV